MNPAHTSFPKALYTLRAAPTGEISLVLMN